MKLTGQQRMILALFLAAGVMFLYSTVLAPKKKPAPPAPKAPATATTVARGTAAPPGTATTATTAAPAPKPAAPTTPGLVKTGARAVVRTPLYVATFVDGGLVALTIDRYPADKEQLIFSRLGEAPRPAFAPLVAAGPAARWEVNRAELPLRGTQKGEVVFTLRDGERVVAESRFLCRADDFEILGRVTAGAPTNPVTLSLGSFATRKGDDKLVGEVAYDALVDDAKIHEKLGGKTETKNFRGDVPWAALRSKYFILALVAPHGREVVVTRAKNESLAATYRLGNGGDYKIYVGPKRYYRLKEYKVGLERTVDLGWSIIGVLGAVMLRLLYLINGVVRNYGVTIIIFSILIKALTYWPNALAIKSSQRMQEIQPILQQLRAKYKDDPQRQNTEMMALYKKYKINPAGGCLPMALQLPVFWALFNALRNDIELKGAPFVWWIKDLAEPDVVFKLPFTIPLVNISTFNILPLLMIGLWVLQNQMTLPGKGGVKSDQQKMMAFMPVIFGFLFYNMPSGLVLYWTINTLLTLGQQLLMMRTGRAKEAAT